MTLNEERNFIYSLLNFIKNPEAVQKIRNFNGFWPRQFAFRLLYYYECDFDPVTLLKVKQWLK